MPSLLIPTVLTSAALATLVTGCASEGEPAPPAPLAVSTVQITRGPLQESADYVGTVAVQREAKLLARLSGTLVDFDQPEGASVRRGDRLATVAAPEQAARLQRAGNEVARLEVDAAHACETYDTDLELHERGVVAETQLDASRARCQAARAALRAARSSRREAHAVSDRRTEQAPFDDRVLRWLAEPGEHVAPGRPLLLLGSHEMEVRVDVVERDLRRGVSQGTEANVRLANGREVAATVSHVAPTSRGPARVVEAVLRLPDGATEGLTHGSSADVRFVLREEHEAWLVPEDAVREKDGVASVYRVREGVLEAVAVTPLLRVRGLVALRGELSVDVPVALGHEEPLEDGMRVYPVAAEGASR